VPVGDVPAVLPTLDIGFQGYFTSRIATDPDPTNEDRGMSGYTMALPKEDRLDQMIRLQADEDYWSRNMRKPLDEMPYTIGVRVASVQLGGRDFTPGAALLGSLVYLDGRDEPLKGAVFESRNNTTGSDDTMAFVIDPFNLRIDGAAATITATDYIDPNDPSRPLWAINDPALYARRLTSCVSSDDQQVAEAIGVFDAYGYFRDRRRFLEQQIAAGGDPATIETYRTRLFQLETWGDRIISKINLRCDWGFDINGPQNVVQRQSLGGQLVTTQPWRISFWFGGWDGDLLVGYMRGLLRVPFVPSA
jgi:hypothetical protein